MLIKEFLETREDGHSWFDLHSDTEGKAVLQVETGYIYGAVCMRDDDPHTYDECDDPHFMERLNEATDSGSAV